MSNEPSEKIFKITFNAKTASHDEAIKHAIETNKAPYTINRGMYDRSIGDETIYGYNTLLPAFSGIKLDEWLAQLQKSNNSPVYITDLGYGTGQFLLDISSNQHVVSTGFGRSEYSRIDNPDHNLVATYSLLQQQPNIELIEGDLPFNESQISNNSQDVIVANNVFLYLSPEMQIQTIRSIISAMKNGGLCLLNQVRLDDNDITPTLLELGLSPEDFEITTSTNPDIGKTLAFRKVITS